MPYDEKPGIAIAIMKKANGGKKKEEKEENGVSEEEKIAASEIRAAIKSGNDEDLVSAMKSFHDICYGG